MSVETMESTLLRVHPNYPNDMYCRECGFRYELQPHSDSAAKLSEIGCINACTVGDCFEQVNSMGPRFPAGDDPEGWRVLMMLSESDSCLWEFISQPFRKILFIPNFVTHHKMSKTFHRNRVGVVGIGNFFFTGSLVDGFYVNVRGRDYDEEALALIEKITGVARSDFFGGFVGVSDPTSSVKVLLVAPGEVPDPQMPF